MHSLHCPKGAVFHFDSDMSGTVKVVGPDTGEIVRGEAVVPAVDLLAFAAHFVRMKRIEVLEEMTDCAILGLPND